MADIVELILADHVRMRRLLAEVETTSGRADDTHSRGHSQTSMTSRYAHVLPDVMADPAHRIGQALWGET